MPLTQKLPSFHDEFDGDSADESRTSQTAIRLSTAGEPASPVLMVLTGLSAGQVLTLDQKETVIGRSHECQLRLADPGISRRHCKVVGTPPGPYILEDLQSTNGTYVDKKRVKLVKLLGGERITVGGEVVVRFSFSDATEEALVKRLYESSTRDPLTGVFTRRYFSERIDAELAYARRHKTALGLVMIDLDNFKVINDDHGHAGGDAVLRGVASHVLHLTRTEDIFARYGGEEFVLLVRGIKPKQMVQLAERVRKSVSELQVPFMARRLKATVSIGVASVTELDADASSDALIDLADQRLYKAKRDGRNRTCAT